MPKIGTIEEIKEYNKHKQAWNRAKKKGVSLTWEEWCSERSLLTFIKGNKKSLTHLLERNVKPIELSNLISDNDVKPEPNLSNQESVKLDKEGKTNQFLDPTKLTEQEKKLIAENKCSTYDWDQENKRHQCQTCSYHRNRNWLFSLDSKYCKDKEELPNFIQGAREWKKIFIDTGKSKSEYYNQAIIKASRIEVQGSQTIQPIINQANY